MTGDEMERRICSHNVSLWPAATRNFTVWSKLPGQRWKERAFPAIPGWKQKLHVPALVFSPKVYTKEGAVTGLAAAGTGVAPHGDPLPPQNQSKLCAPALHEERLSVQLDIAHTACNKGQEHAQEHIQLASSPPQALPPGHKQENLKHWRKPKTLLKNILILLRFILGELQNACLSCSSQSTDWQYFCRRAALYQYHSSAEWCYESEQLH